MQLPGCENACEHCAQKRLVHLGKSSAGWQFTFRAHCDERDDVPIIVKDFESWKELASMGPIRDEYHNTWTLEQLLDKIETKKDGLPLTVTGHGEFRAGGHGFINQEFC